MSSKEKSFKYWMPVAISKAKDKDGKEVMRLGGIASTMDEDTDGEFLDPQGFDVSYLESDGFVNWHHGAKTNPETIIGEPSKVEIKKEGMSVEVDLYPDSKMAKSVYELAQVLQKNSKTRRLGFSIEGKATERDPNNEKIVKKARITGIAITHMPKNHKTFADIIKGEIDDNEEEKVEIVSEEELIKSLKDELNSAKIALADQLIKGNKEAEKIDEDEEDEDEEEKALAAGSPSGQAVMPSHVDGQEKVLTKADVYCQIFSDFPDITIEKAQKIFKTIKNLPPMATKKSEKAFSKDELSKAYDVLGLSANEPDFLKANDDDEDDEEKSSKAEVSKSSKAEMSKSSKAEVSKSSKAEMSKSDDEDEDDDEEEKSSKAEVSKGEMSKSSKAEMSKSSKSEDNDEDDEEEDEDEEKAYGMAKALKKGGKDDKFIKGYLKNKGFGDSAVSKAIKKCGDSTVMKSSKAEMSKSSKADKMEKAMYMNIGDNKFGKFVNDGNELVKADDFEYEKIGSEFVKIGEEAKTQNELTKAIGELSDSNKEISKALGTLILATQKENNKVFEVILDKLQAIETGTPGRKSIHSRPIEKSFELDLEKGGGNKGYGKTVSIKQKKFVLDAMEKGMMSGSPSAAEFEKAIPIYESSNMLPDRIIKLLEIEQGLVVTK